MFRYEEPGFFDTSGYVPRTNPNAAYFLPPAAAPAPRSSAPRNAAGTPMPLPTSVALPAESVDFRQMPSVPGIESEYTRRLPIPQRVPLPMQPMYVTDIDLSDPSTTPQAQWGAQQAKASAMYGATPKPSAAQAINNLAAQHAAQQAMQMGAMYGAAAPPARPSAPTRTNKGRAKQTSAAPSYYEPAAVYTNQDVRAMQRADAQRGYQRGPGVAQPVPSAAPAPAKGGARTITGQPTGVPDYVLLPDQVVNPRFATGKPPAAQKPGKSVNKKASVGNAGAKVPAVPPSRIYPAERPNSGYVKKTDAAGNVHYGYEDINGDWRALPLGRLLPDNSYEYPKMTYATPQQSASRLAPSLPNSQWGNDVAELMGAYYENKDQILDAAEKYVPAAIGLASLYPAVKPIRAAIGAVRGLGSIRNLFNRTKPPEVAPSVPAAPSVPSAPSAPLTPRQQQMAKTRQTMQQARQNMKSKQKPSQSQNSSTPSAPSSSAPLTPRQRMQQARQNMKKPRP